MPTLHIISHTHWDREWYLPFQQFRLKLVHLVDNLLAILHSDPAYRTFMLDGQTIALDDYLQIRPEREPELRALVQAGRILIGPWHVLPDEFLVSPEATVRNLLEGERTAMRFGPKMQVGYIPDPFGHLAQMPQILRRAGIDTACVQRGLSTQPCQLWWQAPDGSRVFMAYLRDGYGNGAFLPTGDPAAFTAELQRLAASLLPHSPSSHLLIMNGNDHQEPAPELPSLIKCAAERLPGDRVLHSTLPEALAAMRQELEGGDLPTVHGELRQSQRHNLLPGVLSARMWIKQRNHACQTLLEKWAEPFSVFATLAAGGDEGQPPHTRSPRIPAPGAVLRHAWRMLMECHPHDSICGCSIDEVHDEMRPRFDQVEQVGEEITRQSLEALAASVDTRRAPQGSLAALVVFNPLQTPHSGPVSIDLPRGPHDGPVQVVDAAGKPLPTWMGAIARRDVGRLELDREGFLALLNSFTGDPSYGAKVWGLSLRSVRLVPSGDELLVEAEMAEVGQAASLEALLPVAAELQSLLANERLQRFVVDAAMHTTRLHFVAADVPAFGYRTVYVVDAPPRPAASAARPAQAIENEYLRLSVSPRDGTLTLLDKLTGAEYRGLNRFVDGGDCGDEYNYCPPAHDRLVAATPQSITVREEAGCATIEIVLTMDAPAGLAPGRRSRSAETAPLAIRTRLALYPGVARVEIATEVDNLARDHRLRVHFPVPVQVDHADYDGHFHVTRRPLALPAFDATWGEQPRPEAPQREFVDVSDGSLGLMLANRGLPEVEVLRLPGGSEIALTLLRCVGWLSRDDLSVRRGHAGPGLPTPGAQMPGRWVLEYAIIPHAGGWQAAAAQARGFNAGLRAVAQALHNGALPAEGSFLAVSPAGFEITAIKPAAGGDGWVLRGCSHAAGSLQVSVARPGHTLRGQRADLLERPTAQPLQAAGPSLSFPAAPYEIVTLRFSP